MYVKRVLPNGVRIISERLDNVRTFFLFVLRGRSEAAAPPKKSRGA